jgi:carbamoyl-phosphate synthase large subunit
MRKEIARIWFSVSDSSFFYIGVLELQLLYKKEDFDELLTRGLEAHPRVLIDKALMGWKSMN